MSKAQWGKTKSGKARGYAWKGFKILREDEDILWIVTHNDVKVSVEADLLEAMNYCETLAERLTEP